MSPKSLNSKIQECVFFFKYSNFGYFKIERMANIWNSIFRLQIDKIKKNQKIK